MFQRPVTLHPVTIPFAYSRFVGDKDLRSNIVSVQISFMAHSRSEPADRKEWGESRFNAALLQLTFIVFWIIRISTLAATGSGFSLFPTDQCEAWTCTVISLLFWAKSYCHHAAFRLYAHRLWSSLLPVGSTICSVLLAALKRRNLCF